MKILVVNSFGPCHGMSLSMYKAHMKLTEFRQPIQVQIHLEMPGILVQLGRIQRT